MALLTQPLTLENGQLPPVELVHQGPDRDTEGKNYHPSLSNLGIAFLVSTAARQEIRGGGDQLFLNTVANDGSEFTALGNPLINNDNLLAFTGTHLIFGDGIYTAPARGINPASAKVVSVGDMLFGQKVDSVALGGFNDLGQIAFWAMTGDAGDNEIVVLATPVPEPATVILLAVGLGIMALAGYAQRA